MTYPEPDHKPPSTGNPGRSLTSPLAYGLGVLLPLHATCLWLYFVDLPRSSLPLPSAMPPNFISLAVFLFLDRKALGKLLATLVPLETACSILAEFTVGESASGLSISLVWLNLLPLLIRWRGHHRSAQLAALLLAALIMPGPLKNMVTYYRAKAELQILVGYLEREARQTGRLPKDLFGYSCRDLGMLGFFRYSSDPAERTYRISFSLDPGNLDFWYDRGGRWAHHLD